MSDDDFLQDLEALKVAGASAAERVPATAEDRTKGLGSFFDGILPKGVTPSVVPTNPECVHCKRAPAERRVNQATQRVFFLGTCVACTDLEWSIRWKGRFEAARKEGEGRVMIRLEREKAAWISGGRRFVE